MRGQVTAGQVGAFSSARPDPGPEQGKRQEPSRPESSLEHPEARTPVCAAISLTPPPRRGKLKEIPLPSPEALRALCISLCPSDF